MPRFIDPLSTLLPAPPRSKSDALQAFFACERQSPLRLDVYRRHEQVVDFDAVMSVSYHYVTVRTDDADAQVIGRFNLGFFEDQDNVDPSEAVLFLHGILGDVKRWAGGRYPWSGQEKYKHLRTAIRRRLARTGKKMPRMVSLSIPGRSERTPWFLVERSDRPDSGLLRFYLDVIYPYLCRQLGPASRNLSLIGESMGGHSAMRLFLHQPAKTYRRVALLCPALVTGISTEPSARQMVRYVRKSGASPLLIWAAMQIGRRAFSAKNAKAGISVTPHLEGRDLSSHPPLFISHHTHDAWGFQVGAHEVTHQLQARGASVELCEMGPHHGHIEPTPLADFLFPLLERERSCTRGCSQYPEELDHERYPDSSVLRMG